MSSAAPGEADGGAPLGNPGTGLRSIRWAWALWSTVSLLLLLYLVLAAVVSHAVTTPLTLSEGARVEMMLVRLFPDTLGLELEFRKDTDFRVKHGDWKYREDASAPGYLRRDQPGLPIRLRVSVSGGAPVLYEALYTTTTGVSYIRRRMTTDLSVEHGLRSLEPAPDVRPALSPGITRVAIEVESVSPALAGETTWSSSSLKSISWPVPVSPATCLLSHCSFPTSPLFNSCGRS